MTVKTERVNISLPIGMRDIAEELGINMSFHAAKAIQAEIELQKSKEGGERK
jgi:post-segregation antitoxin (ccd killing protein)